MLCYVCGIVLYCIVLYCIVLYCIVLYCIALYCVKGQNDSSTRRTEVEHCKLA